MPTYDTYFYIFEDSWQSANRRTLENKCDGIDSQSVSQSACLSVARHICVFAFNHRNPCSGCGSGSGMPRPHFWAQTTTPSAEPRPLPPLCPRATFALFAFAGSYSPSIRLFFSSNIISTLCAGFKNNKRRAAKSIWLIQMTGWIFHYSIVFTVQ